MGYLFILFAVLSNALKGYSSKKVSASLKNANDSIIFSAARGFACFIVAVIVSLFSGASDIFAVSLSEFLICAIAGVTLSVFNCAWILALKSDAYMLVSVCGSASFIVPCVFGLAFLKESFTLFKFLAFIFIILSLFFLLRYNLKLKGKLKFKQIVLLALVLLMQGINQTTQKIYAIYVTDKDISCYTFYMLCISFIAFLPILPVIIKKEPPSKTIITKNTPHLIIMAIGMFAASYFQTAAAKSVESIILYPLNNALSLIAGIIIACVAFKEKMSKDSIIGIILVFFALLFSRL